LRAFAFQCVVTPALSRATRRRAFSATVTLDTDPHIGPDTSGHIPLDARSGRVGARFWLGGLLRRALARALWVAHEGASESAVAPTSVTVSAKATTVDVIVTVSSRRRFS